MTIDSTVVVPDDASVLLDDLCELDQITARHGAADAAPAYVPVDPRRLVPNDRNPRVDPSEVEDLKASIEAVGILQPLVVTAAPSDPTRYQILIGHRRHAAALALNLPGSVALRVGMIDVRLDR